MSQTYMQSVPVNIENLHLSKIALITSMNYIFLMIYDLGVGIFPRERTTFGIFFFKSIQFQMKFRSFIPPIAIPPKPPSLTLPSPPSSASAHTIQRDRRQTEGEKIKEKYLTSCQEKKKIKIDSLENLFHLINIFSK